MDLIKWLLYPMFLSCWRRWFGGGFDFLSQNRFIQHCVGFIVGSCLLWLYGYSIIQVLLTMLILQGFYWAVGHGPAFDMSRQGYPDETMLKRYKRYFWNEWCEFLVPKKYWYGFGYDFFWMLFRYSIPAVLMSLVLWQPYIMFSGIITSFIYAICWGIHDNIGLKKIGPTGLAEFITGFVTGLLLMC